RSTRDWSSDVCSSDLRMSFELSRHDPAYEDMALKFLDHFLQIAGAMTDMGQEGIGLWDDQDNFFYDVLSMPSGDKIPMRLRSMRSEERRVGKEWGYVM